MSCGSCDGRCCAVFAFPHTPNQIREVGNSYNNGDGDFIADMLVPLTRQEAFDRMEAFGVEPTVGDVEQPRALWAKNTEGRAYTCRHWDEETRLCTVYDERPKMCRDYPYQESCQHGCGWELPAPDLRKYIERQDAIKEQIAEAKRRAGDSNTSRKSGRHA